MLKQLQVSKPDGTGRGKRGTLWGKKYDSDYTKGYEWELLENGDVCTRSQREHTVCTHVCPHTDSPKGQNPESWLAGPALLLALCKAAGP